MFRIMVVTLFLFLLCACGQDSPLSTESEPVDAGSKTAEKPDETVAPVSVEAPTWQLRFRPMVSG